MNDESTKVRSQLDSCGHAQSKTVWADCVTCPVNFAYMISIIWRTFGCDAFTWYSPIRLGIITIILDFGYLYSSLKKKKKLIEMIWNCSFCRCFSSTESVFTSTMCIRFRSFLYWCEQYFFTFIYLSLLYTLLWTVRAKYILRLPTHAHSKTRFLSRSISLFSQAFVCFI